MVRAKLFYNLFYRGQSKDRHFYASSLPSCRDCKLSAELVSLGLIHKQRLRNLNSNLVWSQHLPVKQNAIHQNICEHFHRSRKCGNKTKGIISTFEGKMSLRKSQKQNKFFFNHGVHSKYLWPVKVTQSFFNKVAVKKVAEI